MSFDLDFTSAENKQYLPAPPAVIYLSLDFTEIMKNAAVEEVVEPSYTEYGFDVGGFDEFQMRAETRELKERQKARGRHLAHTLYNNV